jgi:hypothetical protein
MPNFSHSPRLVKYSAPPLAGLRSDVASAPKKARRPGRAGQHHQLSRRPNPAYLHVRWNHDIPE